MYHTMLVGIGGLVGSVARYWLSSWVQAAHGGAFPFGTLAVNMAGSFVLGVVMTLSLERSIISDESRVLLATGLCGGFTTMSTFSHETFSLLTQGSSIAALANIAGTLVACLAAVWAGTAAGRLL